jgi:thiol-disulfide isomerase/thioredoxin
MSRRLKFALWAALIGLGAAMLGFGTARFLNVLSIEAPTGTTDFALRDLAGKTHSLADWRGQLVLLNFWATWCPPCRHEIPIFISLQKRYADRGLQIVGISIDDPGAVARYWQEVGINYPLLLADESTFGLMAAYGNRTGGLPFSVLIRPDGAIDSVKLGAYSEKGLEALIVPLLPGAKPANP